MTRMEGLDPIQTHGPRPTPANRPRFLHHRLNIYMWTYVKQIRHACQLARSKLRGTAPTRRLCHRTRTAPAAATAGGATRSSLQSRHEQSSSHDGTSGSHSRQHCLQYHCPSASARPNACPGMLQNAHTRYNTPPKCVRGRTSAARAVVVPQRRTLPLSLP